MHDADFESKGDCKCCGAEEVLVEDEWGVFYETNHRGNCNGERMLEVV